MNVASVLVALALAAPAYAQCGEVELAPAGSIPLGAAASDDGQYLLLVEQDHRRLHPMRWDAAGGLWVTEGTIDTSSQVETSLPGPWHVARSADVIALTVDVFDGFSVTIFEREGSGWSAGSTITGYALGHPLSTSTHRNDVAVHAGGDHVLIGVSEDSYLEGTVRLLTRTATSWQVSLVAFGGFGFDHSRLGSSIDLSGEWLAAGAPGPTPAAPQGRVLAIRPLSTTVAQTLLPSDPGVVGFGDLVATEGSWLVASGTASASSPLEVFELDAQTASWTSRGSLDLPPPYAGQAVRSLDFYGARLSVTAHGVSAVFEFDLTDSGAVLQSIRPSSTPGVSATRTATGTVAVESDGARFQTSHLQMHSYCGCTAVTPNCGNGADPGGCTNASGTAGELTGCGSTSVATDDFVLRARGLTANTWGTPFMGRASAPSALGNGLLCVGGAVYRYAPSLAVGQSIDFSGLVAFSQAHHPSQAQLSAGQTWSFQVWYRDIGGPCGSVSNLTNALTVTFEP